MQSAARRGDDGFCAVFGTAPPCRTPANRETESAACALPRRLREKMSCPSDSSFIIPVIITSAFRGAPAAFAAIAAAAAAVFAPLMPRSQREHDADRYQRQQRIIKPAHSSTPESRYASHATTHATPHCMSTTPAVLSVELSSRRIVAIAATQGV